MDEYVKRQLSSVPGHIGFYYKNLVTGETDGSRQTELFQAASVIKLPILAAILLEEREQAELVRRALGELERPDRELFVRHYYYGQTVARAAEEMGLNPSAAKTRLRRGREKLKEHLRKAGFCVEEAEDLKPDERVSGSGE